MHISRKVLWLVVLGVAYLCMPTSAVASKKSSERLSVYPVRALGTKAITVKWRSDRKAKPDRHYRIVIQISGEGGCINYRESPDLTWEKGQTVTTKLNASGGGIAPGAFWCSGLAEARLVVSSGAFATTLGRTYFRVSSDRTNPTPIEPPGTPVKVEALEGSTLTVHVPGRPDRSSPVTGSLKGVIPGRFKPNTNIVYTLNEGSFVVGALVPDPKCSASGTTYPANLSINSVSSMTLLASGVGYAMFAFNEDPGSVIGCQSTAPVASRPIALVGKVGPAGLVNFTMSGTLGAIHLSEGVDATIELTLVTKIDLSGR